MGLIVVTPPILEPVTTDEAIEHLRASEDDREQVEGFLEAAREQIETITRRAFISRTLLLTRDSFPSAGVARYGSWRDTGITLPCPPAVSITHVKYLDSDGVEQTLASTVYQLEQAGTMPARLYLANGQSWPTTRDEPDAVRITYVAGYGSAASAVPARAKQAIKMLLAHWWENREATTVGTEAKDVPHGVESLVWALRTVQV